jgi:hypothetical protein
MMAGNIWTAGILLLLFGRALLAATLPEKAIRLNLWELNVCCRLSGLRLVPDGGDLRRYIAARKKRVRTIGVVGSVACIGLGVAFIGHL